MITMVIYEKDYVDQKWRQIDTSDVEAGRYKGAYYKLVTAGMKDIDSDKLVTLIDFEDLDAVMEFCREYDEHIVSFSKWVTWGGDEVFDGTITISL